MKVTQTHANLKYFGDRRCLSQSENSKCMYFHPEISSFFGEFSLSFPIYWVICTSVLFLSTWYLSTLKCYLHLVLYLLHFQQKCYGYILNTNMYINPQYTSMLIFIWLVYMYIHRRIWEVNSCCIAMITLYSDNVRHIYFLH